MANNLIESVEAPIMEVWRVEIGIEQGRRLIKSSGTDIVLQVIDKRA